MSAPGDAGAAASGAPARQHLIVSTSSFPLHREERRPRFVYDLATALAEHFDVGVLAPHAPGTPRRERWGAVEVDRFPYWWPTRLERLAYLGGMRDNMRASLLAKLQVPSFLWAQAGALRRLARRRRAAVVNSHWMVPQGLTTAWARGRRGRFVHLLHVHAADVYILQRLPLGGALARYIMRRTDLVFADGSHVRDALDGLLGRASGAVLQPMGAHVYSFRREVASPDSPFAGGYLLYVGRFVEKKGVIYLLRAMPRVRRRFPDVGLVLVGYGPLEEELRREVDRLGIGDAVVFAGAQAHDEVVRQLRGCRLAVVPSIIDSRGETEGMPTVVVETMAAGVRVVASAVDGIPDVVRHGENGWLCRQKDPEDLAEKIELALADPSPSPVVEAALATAETHDWPQVANNYVAHLDQLRGTARRG
jgi:glycosyltransferase involved in cell wall biosynthesis